MHVHKLADKLLFGTDVGTTSMEHYDAKLASHEAVYEACGIGPEGRRKIFRDTALHLLGFD
jgi:predicted TIM-barrel fold metal-dependent hydrolase